MKTWLDNQSIHIPDFFAAFYLNYIPRRHRTWEMKSILFLIINTIVSIGTIESLPALVQTVRGRSFSAWRGVAIWGNRVQKAQSGHLIRPPHQCHTEGMSNNEEYLPDAAQAKKRAHKNAEDQGQNDIRKERKGNQTL